MKAMGLFETKNRLSEICDQVARSGEPCLVTKRGKPFVQIVPVREETRDSVWSTVEESRTRYGPLTDTFELPNRNRSLNRKSPL